MNWLEIIFRILVPMLLGGLALWAGITRIPWTPPNEGDR